MELEDFYRDLRNSVNTKAALENDYRSSAFMGEVSERLAESEEVENLTVMHFEGAGSRNRKMAVQGFDLGDEDGSIALAVLLFQDTEDISTVSPAEARKSLQMLENYLSEAVSAKFNEGREESSAAFDLATDLQHRGRVVTRYRLYLITDGQMSERLRALPSGELNGVRIDYHIWDVQRLHQVHQSQQGREELEIDLTEWIPNGLRALKISGESNDFATYLAAVPGIVIAELYGRFGSRLLEGNVRSFLSARGKVNKGIRSTVLSEPEMFLAYNNGITATATGVTAQSDGSIITHIRDLQIVNGGQTTASLFYIERDDGKNAKFEDVVVQMKLVVVNPDRAIELVPNISRYANSQNKVSEADFFSNSPFHVRMEELSRRVLAPAKPGVNFQTKWFYERTRGQYLNEKSKLSTAEARKFQTTYPRLQLITKTDAAKYEVSWSMKPQIVSSGAQKNFAAFAGEVASKWESSDSQFNEVYFRKLVAKAILFGETRRLIAHASWYQSGYLANIVTYTLAKLALEIERQGSGKTLDFSAIWSAQALSEELSEVCMTIAFAVFESLTSSSRRIVNVTEWAKTEDCWRAVQQVKIGLDDSFLHTLASLDSQIAESKNAAITQRLDNGIDAQRRVIEVGAEKWNALLDFCVERNLISPTDSGILEVVTGRKRGIPSERQSARALEILDRARKDGFTNF